MRSFFLTLIGALLIPIGALAQQQVTKGIVVDTEGNPVIGATVVEKGTHNGVVTDINGNFSIKIDKNSTLTVSYIGYTTQNVKASNSSRIVLSEALNDLNEVVVVGYGTSQRKDITGSVVSVKAESLNSVSSTSISQMLQGHVTGMNAIQNSAQPGAGISVNIRGAASPNGSNSPLYVIDGVPIQTNGTSERSMTMTGNDYMDGTDRDPLNSINPNDIESIEVLKDASAAAIYGASAANGVVLITTKNGKSGKPKVEWRSVFTTQQMKSYPKRLNAHDFREQANLWTQEFYLYNNKMGVYGDNPVDLSGYTPVFDDVNGYTADTDWLDEVSRAGYIIDQNVSVNGGTDKTKYYFSYNYFDNQGLLKQSGLKRHTVRLNLEQEFSKRVKAGIKMSYSHVGANSTSVGTGGNSENMIIRVIDFAPDIPVRDENGEYTRAYNKLHDNPVSFTEIEDYTGTERVFIAPTLDIKIIDGLTLHTVGGYDTQTSTRKIYIPKSAKITDHLDGLASLGQSKAVNASIESYLSFDKTINSIHHISAVLGAGYYKTTTDGFGLTAEDFFTDAFGYNNVGIASDKDREHVVSTKAERTKLSQFFRANYSLLDRYIFTVTARRDGSSYFAENKKWGFFPSASVAWRISEEKFMKPFNALSNLKLRVGYGATGNENILGTNSLSLYQSGYNFLFGNTMNTGLMLTQIENPDLKWETDYTFNVGIDYGFFDQRINGSLEFFHRGVKDLLDYQQLPSNNPVGRVAANIGETKSQGFEFSLNSDNLTSQFFKWQTNLNVSYFVVKWVKRNPEVALADYIGEKDEIDAIYGWETDGIIKSKDEIPSYMPNAYVGNIKYKDQNGDGVLDSKDVKKLGNSTPRWMIGLNNTLSWKNFDLNFYLYSALGFKKALGSINTTTGRIYGQIPNVNNLGNSGNAPSNTWATVATEVWNSQTGKGWMPGVATNPYDSQNPSGYSDFYLQDGSYLKLKSITLGYTLPQKIFANSRFIRSARFFIDAQNVFTITGYDGFDPELDYGNPYPQALSLSFGFNLSF
ncbi:MAG: SusC/RagA family TonB-linked outer membrane protein [Prevotella sp.]|jgi:TonB-linked SusC/RagA family outer membrane protein